MRVRKDADSICLNKGHGNMGVLLQQSPLIPEFFMDPIASFALWRHRN